jgi:hypothetical protein
MRLPGSYTKIEIVKCQNIRPRTITQVDVMAKGFRQSCSQTDIEMLKSHKTMSFSFHRSSKSV